MMTTYFKMIVSSSTPTARSPLTNTPSAAASINSCQAPMSLWTRSSACHGVNGGHDGLLDVVLVADCLDHGPKTVGSTGRARDELWR